jgi:catechol 2,3-dioxygenase-like lactoylglutathione lyase family enzyme
MNFNQITIPVIDLERSINFYLALGLKLIMKSQPDYARFECNEGDSTLSLQRVDQIQTGVGIWVYFEVRDLDNYVRDLIKKGIAFEELPNDKPWLWREAKLKDPDNNQLLIYFAGKNRKNPPWRI